MFEILISDRRASDDPEPRLRARIVVDPCELAATLADLVTVIPPRFQIEARAVKKVTR
jgi:hypothetical protein